MMTILDRLKEYCNFNSEYTCYMLFGIARKKNNKGITHSQEVVFREVIKSEKNITKKYNKIKTKCKGYRTDKGKGLNFYIYISVNPRDVKKGYLNFKKQLLKYEKEILFSDGCSKQLKRIDAVWLSALMKPQSRAKEPRYFLLDIDQKDNIKEIINNIPHWVEVENIVETKNGYHVISQPFNRQSFDEHFWNIEVKTDALMFVEYIEGEI